MRAILIIPCLLGAASAAAQVSDTIRALPEIVVTATRTPLPREAVTASVTVLNGAALRDRGLTTVADALRELPEAAVVRVGSFGGQTALFLRGGESNFTQVLVDGVAVNDPGGAFDFATLTLDNVERIEVLRGPASVLYGSDAVSGVVHVITRGGRGAHDGQVSLRYGTYGTLGVSAGMAGSAGPAAWSVTGARHASDGLYAFNNRFENLVAGATAGLAFGRTTLQLTSRYSDGTFRFPTDGSGAPVDSNQYQTTETTTLGLEAAHRLSDRIEARVLVALNRLEGVADDQPDFVGDGISRLDRRLTRRSADARVNVVAGPTLVTLGTELEGERERTRFESISPFGPFSSSFDEGRRNLAGYAQATTTGRLALSAGARVDENQRFGTFLTVRGGAAYRMPSGTRVRASAGTGFKEPTFFENHGGSGIVGNPDLAPEQAFTWELGAEQPLFAGRLRLEATWFAQRFSDLIEFIAAPPTAGGPNYVNVAGARSDGLEVSAEARLPATRLTARYARLATEVTDAGTDPTFAAGEALVRRPAHALSVRAVVNPVSALTLGGGLRYTGRRTDLDYSVVDFITVFEPARVTLDDYVLADVSLGWSVVRGFSVDLAVENLFDTAYQEAVGFATPGRTIAVGARVGG